MAKTAVLKRVTWEQFSTYSYMEMQVIGWLLDCLAVSQVACKGTLSHLLRQIRKVGWGAGVGWGVENPYQRKYH